MRGPRRLVHVAALALLALPVLFASTGALSFAARNRSDGFIVSSGEQREYNLHVPRGDDAGRPAPLVISMPGAGLWGAAQEETSGWDALADREGFLVVYPTGAKGNGPTVFRAEPGWGLTRDVTFIADLIGKLRSEYRIDPAAIYANGLSNGGGMAFVLSCTLADRIAAVGVVSSAQTVSWDWCPDTRPVPMIAFHGTADKVVPYAGGKSWVAPRPFPAIPDWTARWARRNRCAIDPIDTRLSATVTRRAYDGCTNDAGVTLYTIHGGGHEWPGGGALPEWLCGPFSRGIDATAEMWGFFRAHRLRAE